MIWQELYGNWVLVPRNPLAVIHFLGGAFVASAPQMTYRTLLEALAEQGYVIIATPFVNTFDHLTIAKRAMRMFNLALDSLQNEVLSTRYLPIYGVGHSMGCKLHLLICSLAPQERAGNIFISFNNYPARRSIPMMDQVSQLWGQVAQLAPQFSPQFTTAFDMEFTPSPDETNRYILEHYNIPRNLLVKFTKDDIDQTRPLTDILMSRFPEMTTVKIISGNHLTPLGQDMRWKAGTEFSPLDAIAQFVKQEVLRDFNQFKHTVLHWLNPLQRVR